MCTEFGSMSISGLALISFAAVSQLVSNLADKPQDRIFSEDAHNTPSNLSHYFIYCCANDNFYQF